MDLAEILSSCVAETSPPSVAEDPTGRFFLLRKIRLLRLRLLRQHAQQPLHTWLLQKMFLLVASVLFSLVVVAV